MYLNTHLSQTTAAQLSGVIERITFHNPDNGFCVLRIKARGHRELITVVGTILQIHHGEYIDCQGEWKQDKTYGLQFRAQTIRITVPNTKEGIIKYLSSGLIKGIGKHYAKKMVASFGEEILDIIEHAPQQLTAVEGIGEKRARLIAQSWKEQKMIRDIMVFLHSYGVSATRAARIFKMYGERAIEVVRQNPYRLAQDIHGMGFKTADELAIRLGFSLESVERAAAGIFYVLQQQASEGHCAVYKTVLFEKTAELLSLSLTQIQAGFDFACTQDTIKIEMFSGGEAIYLKYLFLAEQQVAKHLIRLLHSAGMLTAEKKKNIFEQFILNPKYQSKKMQLSSSQQQALEEVLHNKVSIITGGPGVGKTTVLMQLLLLVKPHIKNIRLCAPTGRAAKRLSEVTHMKALTIHRLLELQPGGISRFSKTNPLSVDLLIVDEVSMIDIQLMNQLLRVLPNHVHLILVGDVDQLPSVGPGMVLSDCITSEVIPFARLTEIFRQAKHSKIVTNAHRVNQGKLPFFDKETDKENLSDFYFIAEAEPEKIIEKIKKIVHFRIPERFGFCPIRQVQVLTPMRRSVLGSIHLNQVLQAELNPQTHYIERFGIRFAMGDKVMQVVNNYDKSVFNGDIGYICAIDEEEHQVTIEFDDRNVAYDFSELDEIQLAYACTIHKSQGSEYPAVVMPIGMQHFMLLERNLLYTGLTRGKKLVVLIGEMKAVAMAVKREQTQKRLTNLVARLRELSATLK